MKQSSRNILEGRERGEYTRTDMSYHANYCVHCGSVCIRKGEGWQCPKHGYTHDKVMPRRP